jgi:hypothetical protein
MRLVLTLAFALLTGFALNAQQPRCAPCPDSDVHSILPGRAVCLSNSEMASPVAVRKPIESPGLNEPHMDIDGTVAMCLRFAPSGRVTDAKIISGPGDGAAGGTEFR